MTRATLHASKQIHLCLRKRLAARVLTSRASDVNAQIEQVEEESAATGEFVEDLNHHARREIRRDERADPGGRASLVELLRRIEQRVGGKRVGASGDGAGRLLHEFEDGIRHFDCEQCGPDSVVCNGLVDPLVFGSNGGACLRFLVDLVEEFVRQTSVYYAKYAGALARPDELPDLLVETEPWSGAHGTLAVDGELVPPGVGAAPEDAAVIRVRWPKRGDVTQAILELPYLVFHEIFVHWPQGQASAAPGFQVESACSFTEGAVDSVACDLLDEVLQDRKALPEVLRLLRDSIREAARAYHEERCKAPAHDGPEMDDPAHDILFARYAGRKTVHRTLQDLQTAWQRPGDWATRIILALNLQLTGDGRRRLYKLMRRAATQVRDETRAARIMPIFDRYLEDHDLRGLLDGLDSYLATK
jgi:hypothetical protein